MIEIIYAMLFITVLYIVPLVFCMKKAYEDDEGVFVLIGVIHLVNFSFMFIDFTVRGSETVIKKIKYRNKT